LLRGELDWIVMKALDKDRNRRYESASAFAADVERNLNNEPVQAHPPSAAYRVRKFAQRNKVALAFTALVLFFVLALGGGIAWTLGQHSARQGQAEAKVLEALDEAAPRLEKGDPYDPALITAVERAEAQLDAGVLSPELQDRVKHLRRDLNMLKR